MSSRILEKLIKSNSCKLGEIVRNEVGSYATLVVSTQDEELIFKAEITEEDATDIELLGAMKIDSIRSLVSGEITHSKGMVIEIGEKLVTSVLDDEEFTQVIKKPITTHLVSMLSVADLENECKKLGGIIYKDFSNLEIPEVETLVERILKNEESTITYEGSSVKVEMEDKDALNLVQRLKSRNSNIIDTLELRVQLYGTEYYIKGRLTLEALDSEKALMRCLRIVTVKPSPAIISLTDCEDKSYSASIYTLEINGSLYFNKDGATKKFINAEDYRKVYSLKLQNKFFGFYPFADEVMYDTGFTKLM